MSSSSNRRTTPNSSSSPSLRPTFPSTLLPRRIFIGSIISPKSSLELSVIKRGLLGVGTGGIIRFVEDLDEIEREIEQEGESTEEAPYHEDEEEAGGRSTPVPIPGGKTSRILHNQIKEENQSPLSPTNEEPPRLEMPPPAIMTRNGKDQDSTNDLAPSQSSFNSASSKPAISIDNHVPEGSTEDLPQSPSLESRKEEIAIQRVLSRCAWKLSDCKVVRMAKGSFLIPGFIDTHTHACQVPNIGLGQQYELLDWLKHVTFPRERRFEDPVYAHKTYSSVVQRMLDSGTTTACYYATLHLEASKILAEICNERGQRAFIGRCSMDRNSPIDYIEKNASVSMENTKELISYIRGMKPFGSCYQHSGNASPSLGPTLPSIDAEREGCSNSSHSHSHHGSLSSSSGSPEMDASIARLSKTVEEMMAGSENTKKGYKEKEATSNGSGSSSSSPSQEKRNPIGSGKPSSRITSPNESPASQTVSLPSTSSPSRNSSSSNLAGSSSPSGRRHAHRTSSSSSLSSNTSTNSQASTSATSASSVAQRQKQSRSAFRDHENQLVQPILTPRFAISCTDAMLASISALLSRDPSLRIQTHLSESVGEISEVKRLFPFAASYSQVYEHFNLLGPRTVLAHAIHLSSDEMDLIRKRKCGVSHCPTSNFNLRSGASRVGEMLNRGIKVGLGTDVSGGFGLSMLSAIREASVVAKVLNFPNFSANGQEVEVKIPNALKEDHDDSKITDGRYPQEPVGGHFMNKTLAENHLSLEGISSSSTNGKGEKVSSNGSYDYKRETEHDFTKGPLSIATLFWLATLGGAEVCAINNRVGSLEKGKEFDALLISTTSVWSARGYSGNPGLYIEPEDQLEEIFEKFLFGADDRNIHSVFVRGRVVGGAHPTKS